MNIWVTRPGPTPATIDLMPHSGGTRQGVWATGNPLADGWTPDATATPILVMDAGSLADDPLTPHPANWLRPGRAALDAVVARTVAEMNAERLCLRPHCRQVLSDLPSCRAFQNDHAPDRIGVALAPAAMLEPSMVDDLDEHLERLFAPGPDLWSMVFLSDVRCPSGGVIEAGPLGSGTLPRETVRRHLAPFVAAGTPIVIEGEDVAGQVAWLSGAGGL
ncbi:MAG: hypothetical protein HKN62_03710 [Phycisphaerales bacterium]|nr:hypothetical protein [Phycisphaerales bacterium]